ncbi:MAG: hypothetical protein NZ583_02840 [Desulfobacterota bacterium]|nr:hypothetical protein [Thermodesulfobacteriota bacterium]MDW8001825.1 hypothetical protein [Deltaproteobacteria bacterium]
MGREILYSVTLAEIYLKQGLKQKALEIYEYLSAMQPEREDIRLRLLALKGELEKKGTISKIKEIVTRKVL